MQGENDKAERRTWLKPEGSGTSHESQKKRHRVHEKKVAAGMLFWALGALPHNTRHTRPRTDTAHVRARGFGQPRVRLLRSACAGLSVGVVAFAPFRASEEVGRVGLALAIVALFFDPIIPVHLTLKLGTH